MREVPSKLILLGLASAFSVGSLEQTDNLSGKRLTNKLVSGIPGAIQIDFVC